MIILNPSKEMDSNTARESNDTAVTSSVMGSSHTCSRSEIEPQSAPKDTLNKDTETPPSGTIISAPVRPSGPATKAYLDAQAAYRAEQINWLIRTRDNYKPNALGSTSTTRGPLTFTKVADLYHQRYGGTKAISSQAIYKRYSQNKQDFLTANPTYPANIVYSSLSAKRKVGQTDTLEDRPEHRSERNSRHDLMDNPEDEPQDQEKLEHGPASSKRRRTDGQRRDGKPRMTWVAAGRYRISAVAAFNNNRRFNADAAAQKFWAEWQENHGPVDLQNESQSGQAEGRSITNRIGMWQPPRYISELEYPPNTGSMRYFRHDDESADLGDSLSDNTSTSDSSDEEFSDSDASENGSESEDDDESGLWNIARRTDKVTPIQAGRSRRSYTNSSIRTNHTAICHDEDSGNVEASSDEGIASKYIAITVMNRTNQDLGKVFISKTSLEDHSAWYRSKKGTLGVNDTGLTARAERLLAVERYAFSLDSHFLHSQSLPDIDIKLWDCTKISWTLDELIELYLVATQFKDQNVKNRIVSSWNHLLLNGGDLDIGCDSLNALYLGTAESDRARMFWAETVHCLDLSGDLLDLKNQDSNLLEDLRRLIGVADVANPWELTPEVFASRYHESDLSLPMLDDLEVPMEVDYDNLASRLLSTRDWADLNDRNTTYKVATILRRLHYSQM